MKCILKIIIETISTSNENLTPNSQRKNMKLTGILVFTIA